MSAQIRAAAAGVVHTPGMRFYADGIAGMKRMSNEEVMMWLYDMAEQMRLGLVVIPASGRITALETALEVLRDAYAVPEESVR